MNTVIDNLPSAASKEEYIRALYDAARKAKEQQLTSAYESSVRDLESRKENAAPAYHAAANEAAVQAALSRAAFQEQAAATGLNTGAAGQAALAGQSALRGELAALRRDAAEKASALESKRAGLTAEYKNAIAQAVADNDLQRAQALYEEARRLDESRVDTAYRQAQLAYNVWATGQRRR